MKYEKQRYRRSGEQQQQQNVCVQERKKNTFVKRKSKIRRKKGLAVFHLATLQRWRVSGARLYQSAFWGCALVGGGCNVTRADTQIVAWHVGCGSNGKKKHVLKRVRHHHHHHLSVSPQYAPQQADPRSSCYCADEERNKEKRGTTNNKQQTKQKPPERKCQ